jgi:hypothetical protein
MNSTAYPEPTETTSYDGLPALKWDFFRDGETPIAEAADAAVAFVASEFPDAVHSGVGYWRIPRTARIHYSCATIMYVPMRGKTFPDDLPR